MIPTRGSGSNAFALIFRIETRHRLRHYTRVVKENFL